MIPERALRFGPQRGLVGILSQPARHDPQRPLIIIPNTGFEHRVGPHRLHVHLCRAFADAGYAALRLDLSGMGDSQSSATNDPVADQILAMDELQRQGLAQRFVAIGLCSGGHDVHRLALADRRVAAAAFLDHYLYPTRRSRLTALLRLTERHRLRNFADRLRLPRRGGAETVAAYDETIWFDQPDVTVFRRDVASFMARQMPLFYLFSGEYLNLYNYRHQLYDACPELRDYAACHLHFMPHADHTFSQSAMRAQLIELLLRWLDSQPAPGDGKAALAA